MARRDPQGANPGLALPGAVLCGVLAAAFYLAADMGSSGAAILVFLAQLPLFIAGLWLGFRAAAVAGAAASLILLGLHPWREALLFAASSAGPVIFLVRQALQARYRRDGRLEWYPPGQLAGWLTGCGLAALVVVILTMGGPRGVEEMLRRALDPVLSHLGAMSVGQRARVADFLAAIIPGTAAALWILMTAINAALAQGVLARFGANLRPSPDLAGLFLPLWLPALFTGAAVAAALGATGRVIGVNAMIVLIVPLSLAGLGVLHSFARALPRPAVPLTIFYVLSGLLGWPLVFAALLGLLDTPLRLRRRFLRSRSQKGQVNG
jgi:Predicted membrane protein (DUF2232)